MRVALADDAVLFRQALAEAFTAAGLEVVGQAGDAPGLMAIVARDHPDVVVVDVRMPPTHTTEGLEAAIALRGSSPDIGVLVLSQYVETRHAIRLIQAGTDGVGYLLKERVGDLAELIDAVRRVGAGGSVIDPEVVGQLLGRARAHGPLDELTRREREVLELMAEGRSNQAIADALGLNGKTVEAHINGVFSKLGLEPASEDHRRVLAVLTYLRA
jgi:DNA-binding NarL/FixJ family response regulator